MGLERQTRPVERLRLEKLSRDPLESLCFARTYAKVAVEMPEDVLADHPACGKIAIQDRTTEVMG